MLCTRCVYSIRQSRQRTSSYLPSRESVPVRDALPHAGQLRSFRGRVTSTPTSRSGLAYKLVLRALLPPSRYADRSELTRGYPIGAQQRIIFPAAGLLPDSLNEARSRAPGVRAARLQL